MPSSAISTLGLSVQNNSPLDASLSSSLPILQDPLQATVEVSTLSRSSSAAQPSDPLETFAFPNAVQSPLFTSGYFTVDRTGQVGIDYLFDGGGYQGELAIFSLRGLDEFTTDLSTLTAEIVRRALSDTVEGHVVIRDAIEGARFSGELGEGNQNLVGLTQKSF